MNASSRPRRRIFLRDSVTLLVLLLSALALFAITSFLFRSFMARRAHLGQQYAISGQEALRNGDPERAIAELRTSLSYAPDDSGNRLLLAEALAEGKHLNEARGYFVSLLDTQPADGFVNLQLARLSRQQKDASAALGYYRAAAIGNWSGDSINERFRVQVELGEYLIELGHLRSARAELLIAAADAPEEDAVYKTLGVQLEQAGDPSDAMAMYRRAVKVEPHDGEAFYRAGRIAYQTGDFAQAARLLSQARRENAAAALGQQDEKAAESLLENARRIQELTLSSDLPSQDRVEHLLRALPIARKRFQGCASKFEGSQLPSDLLGLQNAWNDTQIAAARRVLKQDEGSQDALATLIFNTEKTTAQFCGAPTGDDALLLQLANSPHGVH